MPLSVSPDPPLYWRVHVEVPGWGSWSPPLRRAFRRAVEADERIVRVAKLSPLWYPALRRLVPLHPYVLVEVAAVGEGEAYRFAGGAVEAALKLVGVDSPGEPWILSTDGLEASGEAYAAARLKHGARWRRPGT